MPKYIVNGWKPGTYYASVIVEAATAAESIEPGRALLDECAEWELTDDGAASNEVDYIEALNEDGGEPCAKWDSKQPIENAARKMLAALKKAWSTVDLEAAAYDVRCAIAAAEAAGIRAGEG